ncbi:MAG: Si-specific NAD(P)(+) transhydrogenase [Chlamydiota bacterium]
MVKQLKADMVVIGSGPAGQKAAIQAAKLGKKVVVIEKFSEPGGACLNSGTIPSKSLREAILELTGFYERNFYGKDYCPNRSISIADLNYRLKRILEVERKIIYRQFRNNNITFLTGFARFADPHHLEICDEAMEPFQMIEADIIIIACGSKPRNPHKIPFDDKVIFDSKRLLAIDRKPRSMLVLGGGVIGAEYASFFAALGTKVTVLDKREHILPLLDAEIGIHLQKGLTDLDLRFVGNKIPEVVANRNGRAYVKCYDGTELEADVLLYALGREAKIQGLQIDKAGVELDERGHIVVNALFQTRTPHIYAVGDVIGKPALASTCMEQGRLAARQALGVETQQFPTFYPLGIYTIPEISCCGYTEEELKKLGFRYEVGRAYYREIARSHIAGNGAGLFKILFHAETLEILGIHIIGQGASEIIHIGQVAMSFKARIDYFIEHIFNYPTFAEGYRIAALNGINKIEHYL